MFELFGESAKSLIISQVNLREIHIFYDRFQLDESINLL